MKRISLLTSLVVLALLLLASLAPTSAAFVSTGDGSWVWQNPLPQGNILRAVCFADASHAWIVGDGGTILASSDGGATWAGQASGVNGSLTGVSFPDASHGWVTGASSEVGDGILATSDGGAHWRLQVTGFAMQLKDVCFTDALHGCAVGDEGAIVTNDGGATWHRPGTGGATLSAVSFSDSSHGWAVGSNGAIIVTSDGGETWTVQSAPVSQYTTLNDVCFVDALHGWIASSESLLATEDGGLTWTVQSAAVIGTSVSFVDALHGWVACGAIVRATSDGGATWTDQPTGVEDYHGFAEISFADLSHGCAVGGGGYAIGSIVTTGNGGSSWLRRDSGPAEATWFRGVSFADASHGWAASTSGIFATADGGATWSVQDPTSTRFISFIDAQNGWALGEKTLHTDDGGATWQAKTSDLLTALSFPDPLHGWAVGGGGIIVTSDGGDTWASQSAPVSPFETLGDICFVDALHGWAVGEWYYWPPQGVGWWDGIIKSTSDGGKTWNVQLASTGGRRLYAVDFSDSLHGWAVGQTVMKTSDGGLTWSEQQAPASGELNDVKCLTPDQCWAVGSNSCIIHTADGGATWQAQNSGKAATGSGADVLYGVDFVDSANGWVVGSDGTILATSNGGGGPDITPPVTNVSGAFDTWSRLPVALSFWARDDGWGVMGTGIAATQYSLDGGASWSDGTTTKVPAPPDHSNDGTTFVLFRSRDVAGNVESARTSPPVNIDTRKPATRAPYSASARRGKAVTLKYKIVETGPNGGTARVTIKVKNRAGKVVKTMKPVVKPVNTTLAWKFTVPRTWRVGTYRFYVYATDLAGNKQANVASNKLVVK